MTIGIQIFGEDGYTQVDSTYANLVFIEKLSASGNRNDQNQFQYRGSTPIFAIKSGSGMGIKSISNSDGVFTLTTIGPGDIYVFDQPPTSDNSNIGLQTYDENGNLTYSSAFRTLKIEKVLSTSDYSPGNNAPGSYSYNGMPSGNWAAILSDPGVLIGYQGSQPNASWVIQVVSLAMTSTGFNGSWVKSFSLPGDDSRSPTGGNRLPNKIFLVDVSGL